jgi:hypothetical protein
MQIRFLKGILLFIGFYLLAVLVYQAALDAPYYADDYQLVFTNPREAIFRDFFHPNPTNQFYRPLQTMTLGTIQLLWGWETLPIRLVNLFFHVAGAFLVFRALRYWKINVWCSAAGAVFMIVSQMSVGAVAGNDTMSQVSGAFFMALSLWWLYRYFEDEQKQHWRYAGSVIALFLALVSKETSVGVVFSAGFLLLAMSEQKDWSSRIKRALLYGFPFVVVSITYWLLRLNASAVLPEGGESTYGFHFGLNIPKNIGMLAFQSFLPFSSVELLRAIHESDFVAVVLIVLCTIIFAGVILYALWKTPRRRIVKGLCALAFFSWFAFLFLALIGELYAYNTIPYIAALVGIAAEYYWNSLRQRGSFNRLAFATCFAAVLLTNAISVNSKANLMREMGERAEILFPQIIERAKQVPPNHWLYMVNPKDSSFEYSLYSIHGFRVSTCMDSLVRYYSGRPDIGYRGSNAKECYAFSQTYPGIAFTYDPGTMLIYPLKDNYIDTTWVIGKQ